MMPASSRTAFPVKASPGNDATTSGCSTSAHRQAASDDSISVTSEGTFLTMRMPVNNGTSSVHSEILNALLSPVV